MVILSLFGTAKSAEIEISTQQSQVSKLQQKISELEFDRYLAIRDVLTVEQRRRRYYLRKDPSNWPKEFKELNIEPAG